MLTDSVFTPILAQFEKKKSTDIPYSDDESLVSRREIGQQLDIYENKYVELLKTLYWREIDNKLAVTSKLLGDGEFDKAKANNVNVGSGIQNLLFGLWSDGMNIGNDHAVRELNTLEKRSRKDKKKKSNFSTYANFSFYVAYPPDYGIPLQNSALRTAAEQRTLALAADINDSTTTTINAYLNDAIASHNSTTGIPFKERQKLLQRINLALGRQSLDEINDPEVKTGDQLVRTKLKIPGTQSFNSRAETIARTELSASYGLARLQTYLKAGIKSVRWVVLDFRACKVCLSRNGTIHDINLLLSQQSVSKYDPSQYVIPAHPRCRCHYSPVKEDNKDDRKKLTDAGRNPINREVAPLRSVWSSIGAIGTVSTAVRLATNIGVAQNQEDLQKQRIQQQIEQNRQMRRNHLLLTAGGALSLSVLMVMLYKNKDKIVETVSNTASTVTNNVVSSVNQNITNIATNDINQSLADYLERKTQDQQEFQRIREQAQLGYQSVTTRKTLLSLMAESLSNYIKNDDEKQNAIEQIRKEFTIDWLLKSNMQRLTDAVNKTVEEYHQRKTANDLFLSQIKNSANLANQSITNQSFLARETYSALSAYNERKTADENYRQMILRNIQLAQQQQQSVKQKKDNQQSMIELVNASFVEQQRRQQKDNAILKQSRRLASRDVKAIASQSKFNHDIEVAIASHINSRVESEKQLYALRDAAAIAVKSSGEKAKIAYQVDKALTDYLSTESASRALLEQSLRLINKAFAGEANRQKLQTEINNAYSAYIKRTDENELALTEIRKRLANVWQDRVNNQTLRQSVSVSAQNYQINQQKLESQQSAINTAIIRVIQQQSVGVANNTAMQNLMQQSIPQLVYSPVPRPNYISYPQAGGRSGIFLAQSSRRNREMTAIDQIRLQSSQYNGTINTALNTQVVQVPRAGMLGLMTMRKAQFGGYINDVFARQQKSIEDLKLAAASATISPAIRQANIRTIQQKIAEFEAIANSIVDPSSDDFFYGTSVGSMRKAEYSKILRTAYSQIDAEINNIGSQLAPNAYQTTISRQVEELNDLKARARSMLDIILEKSEIKAQQTQLLQDTERKLNDLRSITLADVGADFIEKVPSLRSELDNIHQTLSGTEKIEIIQNINNRISALEEALATLDSNRTALRSVLNEDKRELLRMRSRLEELDTSTKTIGNLPQDKQASYIRSRNLRKVIAKTTSDLENGIKNYRSNISELTDLQSARSQTYANLERQFEPKSNGSSFHNDTVLAYYLGDNQLVQARYNEMQDGLNKLKLMDDPDFGMRYVMRNIADASIPEGVDNVAGLGSKSEPVKGLDYAVDVRRRAIQAQSNQLYYVKPGGNTYSGATASLYVSLDYNRRGYLQKKINEIEEEIKYWQSIQKKYGDNATKHYEVIEKSLAELNENAPEIYAEINKDNINNDVGRFLTAYSENEVKISRLMQLRQKVQDDLQVPVTYRISEPSQEVITIEQIRAAKNQVSIVPTDNRQPPRYSVEKSVSVIELQERVKNSIQDILQIINRKAKTRSSLAAIWGKMATAGVRDLGALDRQILQIRAQIQKGATTSGIAGSYLTDAQKRFFSSLTDEEWRLITNASESGATKLYNELASIARQIRDVKIKKEEIWQEILNQRIELEKLTGYRLKIDNADGIIDWDALEDVEPNPTRWPRGKRPAPDRILAKINGLLGNEYDKAIAPYNTYRGMMRQITELEYRYTEVDNRLELLNFSSSRVHKLAEFVKTKCQRKILIGKRY